jgi:beta-glucanase (GH16 family)
MRRWKLAVGLAVVLGLAIWGLGMQGSRAQPSGLGPATPKLRAIPKSSPSTKPAIPQPTGKPEFSAAFTGNSLDTSVWATCYPYMDLSTGCTNFGNREYQWYLSSQVRVSNGDLRLVARRRPTAGTTKRGAPHEYECRSGMVTTYPSLRFKYGYLQVVARIPAGRGLWPALWLAAANNSWPPEIDMIEAWGTGHKAGEFLHPVGASEVRAAVPAKLAFGWHTFALDWSKSQITWIVDGKVMLTVRSHIPHQKMYLVMNVAESVKPGRSGDCSGSMYVSSVKLWRNTAALASS